MTRSRPGKIVLALLALACAAAARGATYVMMSDAELAQRAPVIVLARVVDVTVAMRQSQGRRAPFTIVTLSPEELLKGTIPGLTFTLRMPGGALDGVAWEIPGTPGFSPGERDILFLFPVAGRPGRYGLTEFGLSKFEIYDGPGGRELAGRWLFLSHGQTAYATPQLASSVDDDFRDLDSFLSALRAAGRGEPMPAVEHYQAPPAAGKSAQGSGITPQWVNIGGVENGSNSLFMWNWNNPNATGTSVPTSPPGTVTVVGTQSNLSDGSNGLPEVSHAIAQWTGVSNTTVKYSGPTTNGAVTVNLDVVNPPDNTWSGPFCGSGIIGEGGPGSSPGPFTFKGDSPYWAIQSGSVWMRQSSCSYDVTVFQSALMHEMGHTLGLGHPDTAASIHSTTTSVQWDQAVMHSVIPNPPPQTLQTDDIQAIQWYYGSNTGPVKPTASFSFSPSSPQPGQTVSFTDTSSGLPTSWSWNFGDGGTSTAQNPGHAYSSTGSYTVSLTVSNSAGSNSTSKTVTVKLPAPTASFAFSPSAPQVSQTIQFVDTSTGSPTSWSWSFGDGATSTAQNPTHAYTKAGIYTVSLTASNAQGSSTAQKAINVASASTTLSAQFAFSPTSPLAGQSVQFIDQSSGAPSAWSWSFGDPASGSANSSFLENPSHVFASAGTYTVTLAASRSGTTSTVSHQVVVAASGSGPVAAFTYSPSSPVAGEAVQFTDASSGSPTSWAWSFGDGATSSSQSPSHVYAASGSYTATLFASNAQGGNSSSQTLTVAPPGPVVTTRTVTIPGVGHVSGAGGETFVSDVEIENASASPASGMLVYTPAGGSAPQTAALSFGAFETRTFADVAVGLFGVQNGLGALAIESSGSPPAPLRMAARTYARIGAGTYGLAAPGYPDDPGAAGSRFVAALAADSSYRTNLGAANTGSSAESFVVVVRSSGGSTLGTSPPLALPPGGQMQWALPALVPAASGEGLSAEFRPSAGSAAPFSYAVVLDNASSDATYLPTTSPATHVFLPAVAHVTGAGGALFTSEVDITNTTGQSVSVAVAFLEHDRDNSSAPTARFTLGPMATRHLTDALPALFSRTETFGAFEITATGGVIVSSRISTANPLGPGTVGQQVDPVIPASIPSQGSLVGLRQDSAFRSNVLLLNTTAVSESATLTLRSPAGSTVASAVVVLPARGYYQRSLPDLFPGAAIPAGTLLTLDVLSGNSSVTAASSIIDDASQDLTFCPELR